MRPSGLFTLAMMVRRSGNSKFRDFMCKSVFAGVLPVFWSSVSETARSSWSQVSVRAELGVSVHLSGLLGSGKALVEVRGAIFDVWRSKFPFGERKLVLWLRCSSVVLSYWSCVGIPCVFGVCTCLSES